MENRSLDDFLDGEKSESEPAEPAEPADPDGTGEAGAKVDAAEEADVNTDGEANTDANAKAGADAKADTNAESGTGGSAEASTDDDVRVDPAGVEPAATTYAAGEGECAACGEAVGERWRGEAGLVCPACKEW